MHRSFSMGALNRAVVLAALAAGVDAAECRGPSTCGCSNNEFCNFDYGSSGGCESCSSFSSAAACGQDGLPSDGEDDCVACCFGSDANDDGTACTHAPWKTQHRCADTEPNGMYADNGTATCTAAGHIYC